MEEKLGTYTKKQMLKDLKDKISSSRNIVVTNYRGLSAVQMDKLRKEFLKTSSEYVVVKNSLAKRVFDELNMSDLNKYLKGEVGLGLVDDIIKASKTVVDFSKTNEAFKLNCAFIEGKLESLDRIKQLASLPPREVLIAVALGCMKGPITGFVGLLRAVLRNFVYAINEIKKKKEGGEKNG